MLAPVPALPGTVEVTASLRLITMAQRPDVNPVGEHGLYLRLFVSNSGGV